MNPMGLVCTGCGKALRYAHTKDGTYLVHVATVKRDCAPVRSTRYEVREVGEAHLFGVWDTLLYDWADNELGDALMSEYDAQVLADDLNASTDLTG